MRRLSGTLAVAVAVAVVLGGCAGQRWSTVDDGRVRVVTTTTVLADLVRNVGGGRVVVRSLVPPGGDPHSHEPTLHDVRDVVYADAAFSNYLLLEHQALIGTLDANLPAGVPNVALAEESVKHAAEVIALVEEASLDTVWLGLRVRGDGAALGADRTSEVQLEAVSLEGPGDLVAYLSGSFGRPTVYVDSHDGLGGGRDVVTLPPDAHSHMSWVFTAPGVYRLEVRGRLAIGDGPVQPMGTATLTFAVGVDPHDAGGAATVVGHGHADVAVDLDAGDVRLVWDPEGRGARAQQVLEPGHAVIEVPNVALHDVPGDPAYRFLGRAGTRVHQLPQAVLGRHVHGEIDPHLWHDVRNAMAYVRTVRDTLTGVDPAGAALYARRADRYLATLGRLHEEVAASIGSIPAGDRHLVTTHDSFRYLEHAYGIEVSGFVAPSPAVEPSLADRRRLAETIRNLDIPAVFAEPNLLAVGGVLAEVAQAEGVRLCPIYGDTLDDEVRSYVELMRHNAGSLRRCLS